MPMNYCNTFFNSVPSEKNSLCAKTTPSYQTINQRELSEIIGTYIPQEQFWSELKHWSRYILSSDNTYNTE